jgi:hypothetical protein
VIDSSLNKGLELVKITKLTSSQTGLLSTSERPDGAADPTQSDTIKKGSVSDLLISVEFLTLRREADRLALRRAA